MVFPSPETLGGFLVTKSSSSQASSSVIRAIVNLSFSFIKQTAIDIPALHCVEYVNTFIIDHIVHYFKQVTVVVETHKQMFIRRLIPNVIINNIGDSLPNGGFANAMIKGGWIELNDNIHEVTIPQKPLRGY
jgi:hypothetical protein